MSETRRSFVLADGTRLDVVGNLELRPPLLDLYINGEWALILTVEDARDLGLYLAAFVVNAETVN